VSRMARDGDRRRGRGRRTAPIAAVREEARDGRIEVRLGRTSRDGVAPSMFVWVERGVERRPEVAREMRGRVVFRFAEEISPLSVSFDRDAIDVFDGDLRSPDLAVAGRLPDIVHLATAPTLLGIPNPASRHGLAAILQVYRGRVSLDGDRAIARGLIRLLAL
jgi:hypothetical protein